MNAFAWLFLSLRGRISRQEFWLGYLAIAAVALILAHTLADSGDQIAVLPGAPDDAAWRNDLFSFGWLELLSLALTWPVIAIYAKRLHDLNLSAWWLLLLPAVTFVAGLGAYNLHALAYVLLLLVLGVLPGKIGANRFGEDPLGRPHDAPLARDR